jgi:2-amino-4-hydroxy-6-hydroxymethyldihydropteridine diphosphokinase
MTLRHDTADRHVLVAFGANLPFDGQPPETTIPSALEALTEEGFGVVGVSRMYRTPCFPAGAGPDYVNAAAKLVAPATSDVAAVLAALHRVEARFGRERLERWGRRTLDIDLLAMGDSVWPDAATQDQWRDLPPDRQIGTVPDGPIVPHPRLQDRAFVLVPLADVAADWVHPRLGQSVAMMLAARPAEERNAVKPL